MLPLPTNITILFLITKEKWAHITEKKIFKKKEKTRTIKPDKGKMVINYKFLFERRTTMAMPFLALRWPWARIKKEKKNEKKKKGYGSFPVYVIPSPAQCRGDVIWVTSQSTIMGAGVGPTLYRFCFSCSSSLCGPMAGHALRAAFASEAPGLRTLRGLAALTCSNGLTLVAWLLLSFFLAFISSISMRVMVIIMVIALASNNANYSAKASVYNFIKVVFCHLL